MSKSDRELAENDNKTDPLKDILAIYTLAAAGANDGLWGWQESSENVLVTPRFLEIFGFDQHPQHLSQMHHGSSWENTQAIRFWLSQIHPQYIDLFRTSLAFFLKGHDAHFQWEGQALDRHGQNFWILIRAQAKRNMNGRVIEMAGSVSNISLQKEHERLLSFNTLHDPLTQLPNRTLLLERIYQQLQRCRRHPRYRFALLFIDIDRFKIINEGLGHWWGDRVLIAIAKRLSQILRPDETLARVGSDDFAILSPLIKQQSHANTYCKRIHELFDQAFKLDEQDIYVKTSIGVVFNGPQHLQAEEMLRDADLAMIAGKEEAPTTVNIFTPNLRQEAIARLHMETELIRSIEKNQIYAEYQPIVSLKTGECVGIESLARWQHPHLGRIDPGQFIPLAEEVDVISNIGDSILEQSCTDYQNIIQQSPSHRPRYFSVNVSQRQFLKPDWMDRVMDILDRTGVNPEHLQFEITESFFVQDIDGIVKILDSLKKNKIQICMDDFGTGYSSLSFFKNLPIDRLKLDASFVKRIEHQARDLTLVKSIVNMARALNIELIIEGIETKKQKELLISIGCEFGQGYFFSKPQSIEKVLYMLTDKE